MSCSYFVLNVWLLIQTYLVFIVNVIISIIEIKCSSLFLIWWRNSKGYGGGSLGGESPGDGGKQEKWAGL